MRSACWGLLALLCVEAAQSAPLPLAVRLAHQLQEQGADGVLRSHEYQERYYRSGDQVWVERELPPWAMALAQTRPEHELNLNSAPRWVRALAQGGASLHLVDAVHRHLYSVAPQQYARTGFSGRWSAEASLLDPAVLQQMQRLPRRTDRPGAQWYGRETAQDYERVLWDASRAFPWVIESGRKDGRSQARTTASPLSLPARWPWEMLRDFSRRELSDLAD